MAPSSVPATDAEAEARRHAQQRRERMALQFAGLPRARRRSLKITDGGGTSRPLGQARAHREFPEHREADRQQQAERGRDQRARRSRRALGAVPAWPVRRRSSWTQETYQHPCSKASHVVSGTAQAPPVRGRDGCRASRALDAISSSAGRWSSISASTVAFTSTSALIDAGLLQREAGRQDRVALRRADLASGSARCAP